MFTIHPLILALIFGLTASGLLAQTTAPTAPGSAAEVDEKFAKLIGEVQTLQVRKRYTDAFEKLDEAEKLKPTSPAVFNIRGSMLLGAQLRDAEKAREQFRKAMTLDPNAMPPHFNLAETDFVVGEYAAAEKGFADVLKTFPKLPLAVRHLVTFKVLICQAKQNKIDEAEKLLKESFTFMDDTPAYYFSKAAIELQKKNEKAGNEWLAKAQIIFKRPADTESYIDSMMEGHYLNSMTTPIEVTK
jgi:tetratricopeptide (TPR) repeat protein